MSNERVQRPDSPESKSDASAGGPGLVPRHALLPADLTDRIARRAYALAKERGFSPGHELDDWLQAEREIDAGDPRNTPPTIRSMTSGRLRTNSHRALHTACREARQSGAYARVEVYP